jgi:hypothetical protein
MGHHGIADAEQSQGQKEYPCQENCHPKDQSAAAGRYGEKDEQQPDIDRRLQQPPGPGIARRIVEVEQDTEEEKGGQES